MKNLFKKLAVAVLCLCLVFTFVACNNGASDDDDDKSSKASSGVNSQPEVVTIVGKWEGTVNLLDVSFELDEETKAKYSGYNFDMKLMYEFKEDGTYVASGNVDGAIEGVKVLYKNEILPQMAEAYETTVEELLGEAGMTEEEYLNQIAESLKEMSNEGDVGKYKFEEGKLFFAEEEEEFVEGDYTACELTATTLKIVEEYVDGEVVEGGMPTITFTKVK